MINLLTVFKFLNFFTKQKQITKIAGENICSLNSICLPKSPPKVDR